MFWQTAHVRLSLMEFAELGSCPYSNLCAGDTLVPMQLLSPQPHPALLCVRNGPRLPPEECELSWFLTEEI